MSEAKHMAKQMNPSTQSGTQELKKKLAKNSAQLEELKQELIIEAALEKVRAASMTMHQSNDLQEVVKVMYEQLVPLKLSEYGIAIIIFKEESHTIEFWFADYLQSNHVTSYQIKGRKNHIIRKRNTT